MIGGKKGWFNSNLLWRIRGWFDRLLLGAGIVRGRRSTHDLRINDVIDFWRVEDMVQDQKAFTTGGNETSRFGMDGISY